jgi:hypothetical protein
LDTPPDRETGGDARRNGNACDVLPLEGPVALPNQVDRRNPFGRHSPREPEARGLIAKILGRFREMLRVDSEHRVERLDFDIEAFH